MTGLCSRFDRREPHERRPRRGRPAAGGSHRGGAGRPVPARGGETGGGTGACGVRACGRQPGGQPVGLAGDVVVELPEAEAVALPRGPGAHVSADVPAVDDDGAVSVQCLQRDVSRAGEMFGLVLLGGNTSIRGARSAIRRSTSVRRMSAGTTRPLSIRRQQHEAHAGEVIPPAPHCGSTVIRDDAFGGATDKRQLVPR